MAGAEPPKHYSRPSDQSTVVTTNIAAATDKCTVSQLEPQKSRRRFVGVRQRPSGRWVAEIKESSQRVRLWLGTYDTPEEAARAYDEAARALRGENARTNFNQVDDNPSQQGSPLVPNGDIAGSAESAASDGRHGLSFSSLKAKLSKNLQSIMARASDQSKSSKSRVSDHFTFASIFHRRNLHYRNPPGDHLKNIENAVQPSIIVPPTDTDPVSWENSSINSDCSSEWMGFRSQGSTGLDSDGGSEIGEVGIGDHQQGFGNQMMMGWIDGPEICPSTTGEGSSSKRFKVSSSMMVPSTFSRSPLYDGGCVAPYSDCGSPCSGCGSPYMNSYQN